MSFFDEQESRVNDFKMSEDINAGYLMNTVDIDDWRFIAGMRYEGTEFEAKGTGATDGVFTDTETRRKYHHWLPGLHARYQLDKNTQVRAAWTKSVVRPTFGQLAPGFVIDDDEATFGNPELKPLESSNLDLGIEHFMGHAGTVSAFVFYKDIKNFVYNTDLAGTGAWTDFFQKPTATPTATAPSCMAWNWPIHKKIRLAAGTLERPAARRQHHLQSFGRRDRRLRPSQWYPAQAQHRLAEPVGHGRQPDVGLGKTTS
nr:hypothetical protein GCM10020185_74850 [Pseudomonas brassicacearum subsp. brassicacearum]